MLLSAEGIGAIKIWKTPLEAWIREKTGIAGHVNGDAFATALRACQLKRLNATITYARLHTPFYGRQLAGLREEAPLSSLSELSRLPFTSPSDLMGNPFDFLAVRHDDIAKIVTLPASRIGSAKRLFFTREDLELTVDFFHHGMSTLMNPGQKAVVFLPGRQADTVGDLLARGLQRMEVHALVYGPVIDPEQAAEAVASFGAHCLIGIPTQILALAASDPGLTIGKGRIKSVLLSTDYVPQAIVKTLEAVWDCRVFAHYGMTEMGLGGGVECRALSGYHLREGDIFFEIVDPQTGEPCPDGITGEVVFTTLTRRGMPLIRYRTGDRARMITDPCPCGSALRRMERLSGRWDGDVFLGPGFVLTLPAMDEAFFGLPDLLDYRAMVTNGEGGKFRLVIDIHRKRGNRPTEQDVFLKLYTIEAVRGAVGSGSLEWPLVRFTAEGRWSTTGVLKRQIVRRFDDNL